MRGKSDLIPYMLFSQLAHLSASIQVKTTPAAPLLLRHRFAISFICSTLLFMCSVGVAMITTRGLCGAFITSWNDSESSSMLVGKRFFKSYGFTFNNIRWHAEIWVLTQSARASRSTLGSAKWESL